MTDSSFKCQLTSSQHVSASYSAATAVGRCPLVPVEAQHLILSWCTMHYGSRTISAQRAQLAREEGCSPTTVLSDICALSAQAEERSSPASAAGRAPRAMTGALP